MGPRYQRSSDPLHCTREPCSAPRGPAFEAPSPWVSLRSPPFDDPLAANLHAVNRVPRPNIGSQFIGDLVRQRGPSDDYLDTVPQPSLLQGLYSSSDFDM